MKLVNFGVFEALSDDSNVIHAFYGSHKRPDKFGYFSARKGNSTDGPGIYLTSSENEARNDGPYVTEVIVRPTRMISTHEMVKDTEVSFLINEAPNIDAKLKELDADRTKAFFKAVDSVTNTTVHNVMQEIWEKFYDGDAKAFCKAIVKSGYDGKMLSKGSHLRYLIYNPDVIEIIPPK